MKALLKVKVVYNDPKSETCCQFLVLILTNNRKKQHSVGGKNFYQCN